MDFGVQCWVQVPSHPEACERVSQGPKSVCERLQVDDHILLLLIIFLFYFFNFDVSCSNWVWTSVGLLARAVLLLAGVLPSATACHLGGSIREMASSAVYAAIPKW